MVGALSGIFASTWIKQKANREIELLEDRLTVQHA
jgi:biopolymer transport protein ExbB